MYSKLLEKQLINWDTHSKNCINVGLIYGFWDFKEDSFNGLDCNEFYFAFDGVLLDDLGYWSKTPQRSLNGKPKDTNYFSIRSEKPLIVR